MNFYGFIKDISQGIVFMKLKLVFLKEKYV